MGENKLNAKYLFYNNSSPVQWGSASQLKKYIQSNSIADDPNFESNIQSVDDLQREINLGTHSNIRLRKIGQLHYKLTPYKNSFYEADLCDVLGVNKKNKDALNINDGYIWLLLVINIQTKMLYYRPLKSKKAKECTTALLSIFNEDIKLPDKPDTDVSLHVDSGGEFTSKYGKKQLEKRHIRVYSSFSRFKASQIERAIATVRPRLTRAMESKGWKWIDLIPGVISKYNESYHRAISMTPSSANDRFAEALFHIEENREKNKTKKYSQKFKKNDIVRTRVHFPRTVFIKGSHRRFSAEVFWIDSIHRGMNHASYKLRNEKNVIMKGTYNDNDLIPAKKQELFNVIILQKRKVNKKNEVLIQYDGFEDPPKWVDERELVSL